jgi:hypothetical protein
MKKPTVSYLLKSGTNLIKTENPASYKSCLNLVKQLSTKHIDYELYRVKTYRHLKSSAGHKANISTKKLIKSST